MSDETFVSGGMVGAGSVQPAPTPVHREPRVIRPQIKGRSVSDIVTDRTRYRDVTQPYYKNTQVIAYDMFGRPLELHTELPATNPLYRVGEVLTLKRGQSLFPIGYDSRGADDFTFTEWSIKRAEGEKRYEALYNDPTFLLQIIRNMARFVKDPREGKKYFARSKYPIIPAGTKVVVVPHATLTDSWVTLGGTFNIYTVEVLEGPAKGLRLAVYPGDVE